MKIVFLCLVTFLVSCSSIDNNSLKFMTFNIRNGVAKDGENHWDKRKHMVFDVIRNYSPDAVGLQEAWKFQIDQILEELPEYDYIGHSREGKESLEGEYSCILFKKDKFSVIDVGTFWLSDTPRKPSSSWGNIPFRICTKALFTQESTQQSFYVYNTHFDHKSIPAKVKSAELVIEKMSNRKFNRPVVFMGDLNSRVTSPQIKYLQENPKMPLVDTHFALYPNDSVTGTFSGFKFQQYNNKIDYIYTEKGKAKILESKIIRYSVDKCYPSDHFPVYTEILFK
ncbi:MAG: endonuclease/exonuclease/phosphatase family protein [Lentisphaerales bacterium]|nr:endonuclease/exonuclease/phosphatase family protein [Lentisphaerales bacterium]